MTVIILCSGLDTVLSSFVSNFRLFFFIFKRLKEQDVSTIIFQI